MHGISWRLSSALALVLGAALAAPAGAAMPDAWITTKTKLALLTTEGVSGTAIHVDTILGKVTLHGKVRSAEEKAKAESIAKKIDGVWRCATYCRSLLHSARRQCSCPMMP
jgi:osmotically-inducible protein OsmY